MSRSAAMTNAVAAVKSGSRLAQAASDNGVTTRGMRNALRKDGIQPLPRGRPKTGRKPRAGDPLAQRKAREHQAKHRKTRHSYKTEVENLRLLLCWEAEQLSEGQISQLLDIDRVSIRKMRLDAIDEGMRLAEALHRPTEGR